VLPRLIALACVLPLACVLAVTGGAARARAAGAAGARRQPDPLLERGPYPSCWSIRPDGSHRRRVLRTRQNCKRPSLSRDRRWVAFDGAPPGEGAAVGVRRPDRAPRRHRPQVAHELRRTRDRPQWSPNGSRISYSRLEKVDLSDFRKTWIWTVRPDDGGEQPVVKGSTARWSPDGSLLVFGTPTTSSDGDLFVARADGSGLRRLLATRLEWPNAWSPGGRRILFTRSFGDGRSDVYSMAASGGDVRRLTRARGEKVGGSWSPDGKRIVFTSTRFGRSHLFVMHAGGGRARELTHREDFDPVWR